MSCFQVVKESCPARVGLMGNPSDGFQGKTLSFCLHNFAATVTISPLQGTEVLLVPHPVFDAAHFTSLDDLSAHSEEKGYTLRTESSGGGGLRLLQATCRTFTAKCVAAGLSDKLSKSGFRMEYDTTIPRMVGLSGSSAIIVAAFRCLMKFYKVSLSNLSIPKEEFPQHILDIECVELGIAAGLQDRVIQSYGGLVHMDFTTINSGRGGGIYTPLDPSYLPELYLVYNTDLGGDSGGVHATVKDRWKEGDSEVINGMNHLASLVDEARCCLEMGNKKTLANLMDENFATRRKLYSDAVVGLKNIRIAELLNERGLAAKFTGSGGAFVCLNRAGVGWLSEAEENSCVDAMLHEGYTMVRVVPIPQSNTES